MLDGPLPAEIETVAGERMYARESVVCERAAAYRYSLDRVNELTCDGYATDETPGIDAGTPVETKAVRIEHHDGPGRLNVHVDTHDDLAERDGYYAIVLYALIEHAGTNRIVVLALVLVEATEVGEHVDRSGSCLYQKVYWRKVVDADVDVERWSR